MFHQLIWGYPICTEEMEHPVILLHLIMIRYFTFTAHPSCIGAMLGKHFGTVNWYIFLVGEKFEDTPNYILSWEKSHGFLHHFLSKSIHFSSETGHVSTPPKLDHCVYHKNRGYVVPPAVDLRCCWTCSTCKSWQLQWPVSGPNAPCRWTLRSGRRCHHFCGWKMPLEMVSEMQDDAAF